MLTRPKVRNKIPHVQNVSKIRNEVEVSTKIVVRNNFY